MDMRLFHHDLSWALSNFSFSMFLIAVVFSILQRLLMRRIPESDIVFRWVALLVLGFSGVFAFIMHAYFPAYAASMIGWKNSPFQFEVATADLAFGLLGILCFNASYGFRLATTVGTIIWLWGDAIGHIGQMILYNNFSLGNAGTWFWMDVTVPFILLICIIDLRRRQIVVVNTV